MKSLCVLLSTVFSLIVVLCSLAACDPEDAIVPPMSEINYMKVVNNVSDTISIQIIRYESINENGITSYIDVCANAERIFVSQSDAWLQRCGMVRTVEEALNYRNDKSDDSIVVRWHGKEVRWGGPMRDMGTSVHNYFNKKSWQQYPNPENDKYFVLEFVITEDDFK